MPDRDAWLGAFSGVFTRIVLFGIEGTSAKITAVNGLSDLLVGTTVSLAEQTPLRWAIEAASPIVGAGRSPSGEIMAKLLKLAAPRAFAVVPLVIGKKLAGLVYGDRGSDPLPLARVAEVFAECEKILSPQSRPKPSPPERTAFKSSARRDEREPRAPRPVTKRRGPIPEQIESVESFEPVETTAPTEPTASVEPTEATAAIGPTASTVPTAPTAPTEPTTSIEPIESFEATVPTETPGWSPPPPPPSARPTIVQEARPWTPFADIESADDIADAYAALPDLPEFAPVARATTPSPALAPEPEEQPELYSEPPRITPRAERRPTGPFPSVTADLAKPIAVSADILEHAEKLVNAQAGSSRRNKWAFLAAALASFAACLFFFAPVGVGKKTHRVVTLPENASPTQVGEVLEKAELVRSAKGFALIGELVGMNGLRAGSYSLTANQWPWQVAHELTAGGSALHDVVFASGLTVAEVAHLLEKAGAVTAEAFIEASHDEKLLQRYGIPSPDVQGWLAPGSYAFADGIPATDVASVMIERFLNDLNALPAARDLAPSAKNDVVVLASLVEKEAKDKSEASRIAGLFTNRLKLNMRLESRAATLYILGIDKRELTLADVRQPSPFNTYLNAGLPPSPIANPGREALKAAADPEPNVYYYMTDKDDGSGGHVFSQTYEEHLKAQRANR